MDLKLTLFLNEWLSGPAAGAFMLNVTEPSNWYAPISVLVLALCIHDWKRGLIAAVVAGVAVGLGDALAHQILKPFFGRVRPCHVIPEITTLAGCTASLSFPSNHAVNSVCIAGALGYFFRPILGPLLVIGLLVSLSRVAVGVHYVSDVTAGAILGFAIGWGMALGVASLFPQAEPVKIPKGELQ